MNSAPTHYFGRLKRRLWLGTLGLDALMIAVIAWQWPLLLKHLLFGVLLGVFYLWSLLANATNPKGKAQFAFSLIRMMLLAYLVVMISGGQVYQFAVVMCGLLSYKVVLIVEYVVQAIPAFRKRDKKPEASL